ncbi:sulfurtransferase [Spongiivirga sp. MCCC 1A20706]|uniref:sulfurtransferase n=1 Tax=Spongiivirga sp. MCCC 1A20706 TaxID=3160963 RepID=UPI00397728D9
MKPLINADQLQSLTSNKDLLLVDARSGKAGRTAYLKKHLKGAVHVDLDNQLSDIKENPANGGRHPLPTVSHFVDTLSNLGISNDHHIVVYDDKNGANAASRFWWMLRSLGHEKVQVLNGGLAEAEKVDFPMSSGEEKLPKTTPFPSKKWELPQASMSDVTQVADKENYLVIDARAKDRHDGKVEPIDLIAGHIPGSINVPFATNLDENGLFLSSSKLEEKYKTLVGNRPMDNVIVHCGSGVTACHTILAMAHAKMPLPKLYVGSWSEWSRNNKPIGTNLS